MELLLFTKKIRKPILFLILAALLLAGCNPNVLLENAVLTSDANGQHGSQVSKTDSSQDLSETVTLAPTFTLQPPTATLTSTLTFTPTLTDTVTPTLTPTWVFNKAGKVVAPILLYHHVSNDVQNNRYYISLDTFDTQMKLLQDWGYTPITISTLVTALSEGEPLPPRPVVLTFDDGNEDIYQNAFPILKKYGYCGTFYIIENNLGAKEFVSVDEVKEMIAAGWEIGSHTRHHIDLTGKGVDLATEIAQSRIDLKNLFGVPINTLAYPFGMVNRVVADETANSGYTAGLGLGIFTTHTLNNIFYLNREEVQNAYDMEKFKTLLPWQGVP